MVAFAFSRFVLLLATLVGLASAATINLPERSSQLSFTVVNKCKHSFAPVFRPALPGRKTWPVLRSGASFTHSFKSDTYRGRVFSPLRNANTRTGAGATVGEFDLATGNYDISRAQGYNVPMYFTLQGQMQQGYCTPAICRDANCKDAYTTNSGLMQANRVGAETVVPNHSCPPGFTNWVVQFC